MDSVAPTGDSIAHVVGRLALWARRAPAGFALIEHTTELSRALVLEGLADALQKENIPLYGVSMPLHADGKTRAAWLLDALSTLPQDCVVSLNGLPDTVEDLSVFNFARDRFAAFRQRLLWWFSPDTTTDIMRHLPDIDRFFLVRLELDAATTLAWHREMFPNASPVRDDLSETQQRFQVALPFLSRLQERVHVTPGGDNARPVWTDAMRDVLYEVFPPIRVDTWKECEALVPFIEDLRTTFTAREKERDDVARLCNQAGFYLKARGLYVSALPLYKEALEIRRRVLGNDHPDTATSINNIGGLYESMGDYVSSLSLFGEALEISRRVLGNDHPDTAGSINNMGFLYRAMGDNSKALPLYEEALKICRRVLGNDHPNTAQSINNMGALYESMGDYVSALSLFSESLEIRRRVLGNDHPDTAQSINNIGALYQAMGDNVKALPLLAESLEIRRRVLGNDHPSTAQSINNMGYLYDSMGDNVKALLLLAEALEIRRRVLGSDHPETAQGINNMGALYESMGDYVKALPLYEEALEILEHRLGSDHPNTKVVCGNLERCQRDVVGDCD
jgi:tetratricopeptide (TPR) repeat protein